MACYGNIQTFTYSYVYYLFLEWLLEAKIR